MNQTIMELVRIPQGPQGIIFSFAGLLDLFTLMKTCKKYRDLVENYGFYIHFRSIVAYPEKISGSMLSKLIIDMYSCDVCNNCYCDEVFTIINESKVCGNCLAIKYVKCYICKKYVKQNKSSHYVAKLHTGGDAVLCDNYDCSKFYRFWCLLEARRETGSTT